MNYARWKAKYRGKLRSDYSSRIRQYAQPLLGDPCKTGWPDSSLYFIHNRHLYGQKTNPETS
jgi:hypothetical protein